MGDCKPSRRLWTARHSRFDRRPSRCPRAHRALRHAGQATHSAGDARSSVGLGGCPRSSRPSTGRACGAKGGTANRAKVAVDKDYDSRSGEHDVGRTRKSTDVLPEAEPPRAWSALRTASSIPVSLLRTFAMARRRCSGVRVSGIRSPTHAAASSRIKFVASRARPVWIVRSGSPEGPAVPIPELRTC